MVGYAKFRVVRYQNSWIRAGSVACIIMWGGIAASFSKKDVWTPVYIVSDIFI
jgi:hypothetical protein